MNMINVQELRKSYGAHEVLKGVTFSVQQGEIFALLGANGAGKTTALECIENLRRYDSGTIELHGDFGVQLQASTLPDEIKVGEALKLFASWKNTSYKKEVTTLDLEPLMNKKYRTLSTGQKRRVHLVLALLGNPDILFLDEPTAGVDVEGRIQLHQEIRNLQSRGKTIILASHDMTEVENLCTRIGILREGKIAYIGTPQELKLEEHRGAQIGIKADAELESIAFQHADLAVHKTTSKSIGGAVSLREGSVEDTAGLTDEASTTGTPAVRENAELLPYLMFNTDDIPRAMLEILSTANEQNIEIHDIIIKRESLEERFLEVSKEGQQ